MNTPARDQVRKRSRLLRSRYTPTAPGDDEPDDLLYAIEDSAVVVSHLTGRRIAPATDGEELPAGLVDTAIRAVARMAELMDTQSGVELAEAGARGERLRSFTAGPYSESYFTPGDLVVKNGRPQMSPDTLLDSLLWALATQDAKDAWIALATGVQPPAGVASNFDYRKQGGGYFSASRSAGFIGGPDGF